MALIGLVVALIVVNAPIVPVPFAPSPIEGAEFTQEYEVPVPVNGKAAVEASLHQHLREEQQTVQVRHRRSRLPLTQHQ